MILKTFFEKFDQFADAPGAVAKMRELVQSTSQRDVKNARRMGLSQRASTAFNA